MFAGPVVGPGKAAVDDVFVDSIQDFKGSDDSSGGQHFDFQPAGGHGVDTDGHTFDQLEIDAGARDRRLDLEVVVLGPGIGEPQAGQAKNKRQQKTSGLHLLHLCPPSIHSRFTKVRLPNGTTEIILVSNTSFRLEWIMLCLGWGKSNIQAI